LAEEDPPAALLFRVDEVIELVRCPLLSNVRFTPERANVSNARSIILPMTLPGFSRKRNKRSEDGRCGDLHPTHPSRPPLRSGPLYCLMSRPSVHGAQVAFSNLP
jgi:hypothetical protein